MISWRRYIPALGLAAALAAFAGAVFLHVREDRFAGSVPSLIGPESAAPDLNERPVALNVAAEPSPAKAPEGLTELTMVTPDHVRLEIQRPALVRHFRDVRLAMLVPDAMSYASKRQGGLWILSAASGPDSGFFLFSEKSGGRRLSSGVRKFLRDFFKDTMTFPLVESDAKFLSRGMGELTWIRGQSDRARRFDAYALSPKASGFRHLLFIYDPTVANASRRQMIDSIRVK